MEIINYEKNDVNILINQCDLLFNNYLYMIKDNSQLSNEEINKLQIYYKNLLIQLKKLLETLKATNISLQQIGYNTSQEKKLLDELYNNIALNDSNNPILNIICTIINELNSLNNLPTTTIGEIQKKYFLMNNHFISANYYVNQPQIIKYKKKEK